jgi:hypothetical protein
MQSKRITLAVVADMEAWRVGNGVAIYEIKKKKENLLNFIRR